MEGTSRSSRGAEGDESKRNSVVRFRRLSCRADVAMDAPKAGIVGWYSDVPCWAEGVKKSRAVYLREQKKQRMCDLWWKAHQSGKVPPNADKNWGCPRGDQCDFAHGLDELTGEGRDRFLREQRLLEKQQKEEAFVAIFV